MFWSTHNAYLKPQPTSTQHERLVLIGMELDAVRNVASVEALLDLKPLGHFNNFN